MRPGLGGTLGEGAYLNVIAYLLETNGHEAGPRALQADPPVEIGAARAGDGRAARAAGGGDPPDDPDDAPQRRRSRFVNREAPARSPVTDELLQRPPAEVWLSWRRTLVNHGYSPLDRITVDNVHDLRLAWSWPSRRGTTRRRHSCTTA